MDGDKKKQFSRRLKGCRVARFVYSKSIMEGCCGIDFVNICLIED
jgi:hypothetical protein